MKRILSMALAIVTLMVVVGALHSSAEPAVYSEACIYGTAHNQDGSKIDGTARISTSWNGKEAYPKNGEYRLCLGSNPKGRITIYLDGNTYREIYVDGNTRVDIVRR